MTDVNQRMEVQEETKDWRAELERVRATKKGESSSSSEDEEEQYGYESESVNNEEDQGETGGAGGLEKFDDLASLIPDLIRART